ncbi:hypothetical protein BDP27DRAFT_1451377 [Rhodocollybia butyracea]|uniref:Uncharacterized protein n=1 Tax=Rhodocollybia butyracea TaxID=206335 RepID=A0A9P5PCR5_9AGAR|nr:hypothetical protein BDP27DRAFT_1451377 [Rhodocollybia butyracea]
MESFPSIISNLQLPTWLVTSTVRPEKLRQSYRPQTEPVLHFPHPATTTTSRLRDRPNADEGTPGITSGTCDAETHGEDRHSTSALSALNVPSPATRLAPTPVLLAPVDGHTYDPDQSPAVP